MSAVVNAQFAGRLFVVILVCVFSANAIAVTGPQELVETTSNKMLNTLKEKEQALKKNPDLIYGMVSEIVLPHFDFIAMSRWVLGKHWRRADKSQKLQFVKAFRTLLVRTYATALLEYTGQDIRFLPLRDDPAKGDVTVKTEVIQKTKAPIIIKYNLHLKKEAWKVYDLSVDGVSLIANYRTSFGTEISQTSLDALIKRLEKHNTRAEKAQ
ncbi:MAG: ABC transporter substrate-binding protein [Gammaproteobacteria bacterium]|nr:ABC transporter substrate-binding protein [Gammaproteobacteria bacterium]MDH5777574.1 ABC transporter substrate-binding protein [Gammaproteobacteria bacterium]